MEYKAIRNAVLLAAAVAMPTICEPRGGCAVYGGRQATEYRTSTQTDAPRTAITTQKSIEEVLK